MKYENTYKEKIEYFDDLGPNWDETVGNNEQRKGLIRNFFTDIAVSEGMTVLDVGCGNGVLLPFIAEKTGPSGIIHAIDPSPSMIKKAGELYSSIRNITYHTGIIETADFPEHLFDIILCFAAFPHFEDQPLALQKMRKLLKENGRLYIFHLSDTKSLNEFHSNLNGPVSRDHMPEEEEIQNMLKESGYKVKTYIDIPGKNFIEAVPC
jgi:ubiquinone/menaquinone biosynthesis C-methylase UbiE